MSRIRDKDVGWQKRPAGNSRGQGETVGILFSLMIYTSSSSLHPSSHLVKIVYPFHLYLRYLYIILSCQVQLLPITSTTSLLAHTRSKKIVIPISELTPQYQQPHPSKPQSGHIPLNLYELVLQWYNLILPHHYSSSLVLGNRYYYTKLNNYIGTAAAKFINNNNNKKDKSTTQIT